MAQIKKVMNMVRSAGNPQAMLSQMPQYSQAMSLIQESGGDARAAFYKLAEQQGINPDELLKALS